MVILVGATVFNVAMAGIMMSSTDIKIIFITVVIAMHDEGTVAVTLDVGRHLETH